ncbi:Uncharacterised protein [BD1-7 clade bacterium]|uniref:DUF7931 domain-containing protein n=1 Tax=BD1-7 clade bacterium TaxID=2029982 RepID=A0A5S9R130_9GAMM|nr:Uncharacterised protein [BD1-7 clade bacterium]
MRLENTVSLDTPEQRIEKLVELVGQATRTIRIRSGALDPELFDTREFADCLSTFARSSRAAAVHIMVDDPGRILSRGHRILELSRRLNDKIQFRTYYDEPDIERDSMILIDRRGLMLAPVDSKTTALSSLTDAVNTINQVDIFDHHWQMSSPSTQLRQLSI